MYSQEIFTEGCYYHLFNKGVNQTSLFLESENYRYFLEKFAYYCYPVVDTYAYCLLDNYFHFLVRVRPKSEQKQLISDLRNRYHFGEFYILKKECQYLEISQQLRNTFNCYTQSFNKRYNQSGNLFAKPLQRKQIKGDRYFTQLVCYIHQNPVKHGFAENFREHPHSSYRAYLSKNDSLLNRKESLEWFGGLENFKSAHEEIEQNLINKITLEN